MYIKREIVTKSERICCIRYNTNKRHTDT